MNDFDAEAYAKKWVGHAKGLGVVSEEHAKFVEASLMGWFKVVYEKGKLAGVSSAVGEER